jgi:hypothetical protein
MKTLTEYTVYLKMEDGQELSHEVKAEDEGHATGLAIAWATKKTDKQVQDYDYEIGETYELISEDEASERYDEMLNEMEWCKVGTMEFAPSRVLSALDPIAYNCGFSDYTDSLTYDRILVEGYTD